MKHILALTVLIFGTVEYVSSFSSGVPPLKSVCLNMLPQHDKYTPQTSSAPFEITINNSTVNAGGSIEITLKSTGEAQFKGFYVQGRDNKGNPVGSFELNQQAKAHSCNGIRQNGAHHADGKQEKSSVAIKWTAPKNYDGPIQFTGTFVKDFVHIWSGVNAEPLSVKMN